MGVDVFFVLSGMLMSNILFIDRIALRDFYIRRFSRVVPALVVFLCGAFCVALLLKYDFEYKEFFASLVFIRTYYPVDPSYFDSMLPTGHLWSLNVEEHSYVIMSLMSLLLFARGKVAAALFLIYAISVGINLNQYLTLDAEGFKESLFRTESAIVFIMFSAAYNLLKKELSITLNEWLPPVFLILAFLCYLSIFPIWLTFIAAPILLGVAVNHLVECAKPIQTLFTFAPLRQLGVLSYSIYLWQQIFYMLYYALPFGQVTGFVLSIVIGAGSFYILETPIRYYINRRWSPNPQYRRTN